MPTGPAARTADLTAHIATPLAPGPGSPNVLIGMLPAWRGVPTGAGAALQAAKAPMDVAVQTAVAATVAAGTTPAAPAAYAAEQLAKTTAATAMAALINGAAASGADKHMCPMPSPVPPHGVGVVIDGSKTVMINNLPACRMGDTVLESLGPPNKIVKGEFTVIIGG